jgi:GTP-binding protein Era
LADDYAQVQIMLNKLEHEQVHVGVLGRVSVGKSSLLNALLGRDEFGVSALHGETRALTLASWQDQFSNGTTRGVFLIDTPGLDEVGGEARELLAREAAARVDLLLFVVDGDLTATEAEALKAAVGHSSPILLILNKIDRYGPDEQNDLLNRLRQRCAGLIEPGNVLAAAASPAAQLVVRRAEDGSELQEYRARLPQVSQLKERLWDILEREGHTLAAMNAALFAGDLSDKVAARIVNARSAAGERMIHIYSLSKGVAVAINPIPIADLAAALVVDVSLVVHLSRIYGLPLTSREAGALVRTIVTELITLMGTVWAVHLVASALKLGTAGLSTVVTAGVQGAVGYYGTYVVGKVGERYLMEGKSWGAGGPKEMIQDILDKLDKESILAAARGDILARLKYQAPSD